MDNTTTNKPRDFFIHISAFVVLYFVAIALATLLFTLIDYRYPDTLGGFYGDPYSGPVRFAIASLIILSPLFVILMRFIQGESRRNPDRTKLAVRKWLTYITLFFAGITAIADAITLLNSFLGGALATAFMYKTLSLFVIAGTGFAYFYFDLKNYWQEHVKESSYSAIAFLVAVFGTIMLGFAVLGSPAVQRDIRLDAQRVSDLSSLQYQVVSYWQQNEKLPSAVVDLDNPITGFTIPVDPDNQSPYEFTKKSDLSFELCANFARATSGTMNGEYYPEMSGLKNATNWEHGAGHTCFERSIDTNLIKSLKSLQINTMPGVPVPTVPVK